MQGLLSYFPLPPFYTLPQNKNGLGKIRVIGIQLFIHNLYSHQVDLFS